MAMKQPKLPKPTDAELAVLQVLWRRGPSTVREVWENSRAAGRTGYTTVLKTLQIMFEKGLVERDEAERSHVYKARVSEGQTQRRVIGDLLKSVFAGSAPRLVMQALSLKKATPAELAEIRKLLNEMEGGKK